MRTPFFGMVAALLLAIAPQAALADEVRFPELTGPVVDLVDEIPADREEKLAAELRGFMKRTGHQLQVVTVPDLQGLSPEDYGVQLGRHWGIGRAGVNDGIILLHSVKEKAIRIEIGKGAEAYLPDGTSKTISRTFIVPAFKEGRFADGIVDGAHALMETASITPEQRAEDERKAAAEAARRSQAAKDGFLDFLMVVLGIGVVGGAGWGTWRLATLPRRRREAEAARLAEIERRRIRAIRDAEHAAELAAQRAAAAEAARIAEAARAQRQREAEEAEERERQRRVQARKDMLAAMSPTERQAFLDQEEAERRAEAERTRRAEAARRERLEADRQRRIREDNERAAAAAAAAAAESERRAERRRQEERDEENRRSTTTYTPTYTPTPTPSSSSDGGWSGGGGDFGGGGSTDTY